MIVIGEYNVLRTNVADVVEEDLHQLEKDHDVQLLALCEANSRSADRGVDSFVSRMAWSAYQPKEAGELALCWNPDLWRAVPFFGVKRLSDQGPVKFTPPRFVIWQGLYHRPSQTRHLIYATHLTQGYAKTGADQPPAADWRDTAARTALLRLVALTASHMVDQPAFRYHHLAGDLNARQSNRDRWWYPHPVLESLWERDTVPPSLDYLMHSHASVDAGLKVVKRYRVGAAGGMDSDHAAQIKQLRV